MTAAARTTWFFWTVVIAATALATQVSAAALLALHGDAEREASARTPKRSNSSKSGLAKTTYGKDLAELCRGRSCRGSEWAKAASSGTLGEKEPLSKRWENS